MTAVIRLRSGDRVTYQVWAWTGQCHEQVPREAQVLAVHRGEVRLFTVHDGGWKRFTLPAREVARA